MNYLIQGMESRERVELLLSGTRISSESQIGAIYDHLVAGHSESDAASLNDVSMSNFNRAIKAVNKVAELYERLKEEEGVVKSVKR